MPAYGFVAQLWQDRTGVLSTQVLQELYVSVRRKVANPLGAADARQLIDDYIRWEVVVNDGASILDALEIEKRFKISFWDALIIQAANASGARILYSEDLNHSQTYGSVRVVNPFHGASRSAGN